MSRIVFVDTEVDLSGRKVLDAGGITDGGAQYHGPLSYDFVKFMQGSEFACGHNILGHDIKYIGTQLLNAGISPDHVIDTLYLSPLLFPKRPYHALLKDDKLQTDELNNPLNDSRKAMDLFNDELSAFMKLEENMKNIYFRLLSETREFGAFFKYVSGMWKGPAQDRGVLSRLMKVLSSRDELVTLIHDEFAGRICEHADLEGMIHDSPVALAYSLALIRAMEDDSLGRSITPPWVLKNYPAVEQIMFRLRSLPCLHGCSYCNKAFDVHAGLKRWFGFNSFRTYNGDPLQEMAVKAAVDNRSLLAVFPTGGGKSLTFQLPALMAGENSRGLTVVISPLQSLMKDQVDGLEKKDITEAVTINGLLDPVERAKSFERVESGDASILYISPESLRSSSIERMIIKRNIARFVIDEAHCFSSWGQDFRVDYLYIADFIKSVQEKKNLSESIPVSCFTATAKPQVIKDICDYFKDSLNLDLKVFKTSNSRANLHYTVLPEKNDNEKYQALRSLLEAHDCPAIVYVMRTAKAESIAERLSQDGFRARAFHGKMPVEKKVENQNAFMSGEVRIIVATSAFGMGVDKSDVGLVVHYEISDSLENYVQEAGRAGRDASIDAECYVLYNEEDLSKHFLLLNQTKMTIKEIQQVWKAVKNLTKFRSKVSNSALEIARLAGWDDSVADIETRVRTAIASLEQAGYLKRGRNMPRVYATGILVRNAQEAIDKINASPKFDARQRVQAVRIIKSLIASRSRQMSESGEAESRLDYLSDRLGIAKEDVIRVVNLLREIHILADSKDLTVYFDNGDSKTRPLNLLKAYNEVENFLCPYLFGESDMLDYKHLNEDAAERGLNGVDLKRIKTILNFWAVKGWIRKKTLPGNKACRVCSLVSMEEFERRMSSRQVLSKFIVEYLFSRAAVNPQASSSREYIEVSELEIQTAYAAHDILGSRVSFDEVEDALFYLSRIGAVRIEGGFLVIYNTMSIERLELDNKKRFKLEDYQRLSKYYENRIQQIHIVGEYAKKMISDYKDALEFVDDYFRMDYVFFLNKYFRGRQKEISTNITPAKFRQIFGELSAGQLKIINDRAARYIVVAAGPGSGKTKLLVHKLASMLMMEDVRHEQLLMLTFSRAAATEFKSRLYALIGGAAGFVEIKTFHSYCFDLLGRIGSLDKSDSIVKTAVEKIYGSEVDVSRITKTVLVIDEAQDMDGQEFELVKALMRNNEEMRVVVVGDDDQNIYEFRGSTPEYMEKFLNIEGSSKYELVENFRSAATLVDFSNMVASKISHRLKVHPIVAKRQDQGTLRIVSHRSSNLEIPVVREILATKLIGTTAVLARTNAEALCILGLLLKEGIPARLIQGNEGFNLMNLAEIRFFYDSLGIEGAVIEEEDWNSAKSLLNERYRRSDKLYMCHNLIRAFEITNPKTRYVSDFESFVLESSFEDFVNADLSVVLVSTIHKVKGKEFDNVFLAVKRGFPKNDEELRQLYVAVTRAKTNLSIHTDSDFFDQFRLPAVDYRRDMVVYPRPEELTLQLSLRDVWLDGFASCQASLSELRCGDRLGVSGNDILGPHGDVVVRFSKNFKERYDALVAKGYVLRGAQVNFLVWWKGADKRQELLVMLPRLLFVR